MEQYMVFCVNPTYNCSNDLAWCYLQNYAQQYVVSQFIPIIQCLPCYYVSDDQFLTSKYYYSPASIVHQAQNLSIQDISSNYRQQQSLQRFPKIKYAKKNAESNVINRIFSYLSMRPKSQKVLRNIFNGHPKKINIYYEVMKQIRRKNKKYINRCYLKQLIEMPTDHIGFRILQNIDKKSYLGVEEMKRALRILINHYMKTFYVSSILTSSKLDKQSIHEHIQRGKQVFLYLMHEARYY